MYLGDIVPLDGEGLGNHVHFLAEVTEDDGHCLALDFDLLGDVQHLAGWTDKVLGVVFKVRVHVQCTGHFPPQNTGLFLGVYNNLGMYGGLTQANNEGQDAPEVEPSVHHLRQLSADFALHAPSKLALTLGGKGHEMCLYLTLGRKEFRVIGHTATENELRDIFGYPRVYALHNNIRWTPALFKQVLNLRGPVRGWRTRESPEVSPVHPVNCTTHDC